MSDLEKTEEQWREQLSPEEFAICRQKGTERAFTGVYNDCKLSGNYLCKCCGEHLFDSATKFDSGSGWPSFYQPATDQSIVEERDVSHGMARVEVMCSRCGSHLGHVFNDGPQPSGQRYCINSASLNLQENED